MPLNCEQENQAMQTTDRRERPRFKRLIVIGRIDGGQLPDLQHLVWSESAWSTSQAFAPDKSESVSSLIKDPPRQARPFRRSCRLRMDILSR